MKIGILQTGHSPEGLLASHGDYDSIFAALLATQGLDAEAFPVVDGIFPADIDTCDGWLITGSRFGAYEDHDWIPPLEDLLRRAYAAGIPIVGICFGHQILAQALGGKVEKFAGGWSVGPTAYEFEGRSVTLNAWHQDQVTEIPAEAKVIGRSAFCENAMLAYGDTAFSVQAHPEYSHEFIKGLADTRGRGLVPDALLEQLEANLDLPLDQVMFAERIGQFFKTAQTKGRAA